jgi:hypothetical protein
MGRMRTEGAWMKPTVKPKTISVTRALAHLEKFGALRQGDHPESHHYRGSSSWVMPMDHPCRTAWLYAIDALPWKMAIGPLGEAALATYDERERASVSLALGANVLKELDHVYGIVKLKTVTEVRDWMINGFGPVVVGGYWYASMWDVDRQTGFVQEPSGVQAEAGHAVALVGVDTMRKSQTGTTEAFRFINNLGMSWGHMGRAWMTRKQLTRMLKSGEAYAIVPMTPEFKKKAA